MADGPVRVGHKALDRAHHQAPLTVVAERGVDGIRDRKAVTLRHGPLRAG